MPTSSERLDGAARPSAGTGRARPETVRPRRPYPTPDIYAVGDDARADMGASGTVIMGFFGAVFAAMALAAGVGWHGPPLAAPFLMWAAIALAARRVGRRPSPGVVVSPRVERAIVWSSAADVPPG